MANFEDIQRKYNQLIASQDNIINKIASYGVGITSDTPFQQYADMVEEAVSTKLAGSLDGLTEFNLDERDFEKVTIVRRYAFYQNTALKKVIFPETISAINNNAFYNCTNLVTVILKGKTSILTAVFYGCTALEKIYLPDVENIDEVPTLGNVNAFTNTTCNFIVSSEEIKSFYTSASNWNTFADRFIVEVSE